MKHRAIVITGVSGSGKTSVGLALAQRWGYVFRDGDDFHPPANVQKMRSGQPLTDADRAPWLAAIHDFLLAAVETQSVVVACSALKACYRDALAAGIPSDQLFWVHLHGDFDVILSRMQRRQGHFMPAALLQSQFDAYEPPTTGLLVEVDQPLADILQTIEQVWIPTS